jgi:NitT/TauT family transport system ATP-binding protein
VQPSATSNSDRREATKGQIRATGVVKRFGEVAALDGIDLTLEAHARVAIVGPSGCGKSTFLSIVAGLETASEGRVEIDDASSPSERLSRCALMPQKDLLLPWRSALDNACLALENQGVRRREARRRAQPLFERFGLESFESRRPAQLSGGMRQRISFLRTLLAGKDVLLLDEPFGALDALTRAQAQQWLLSALDAEPRTTLLVTHDVEEAILLCERIIVLSMRPGRIVLERPVDIDRTPPRREIISSPEFVRIKELALEALEV